MGVWGKKPAGDVIQAQYALATQLNWGRKDKESYLGVHFPWMLPILGPGFLKEQGPMVQGPADYEDEKTHLGHFLALSLQEFRTLEVSGRLAALTAKVKDFRLPQV